VNIRCRILSSKLSEGKESFMMAGACFGNVALEGVSFSFREELYRMVKELAIARGFGKQVRIGAEPCQYDSDDVSSGSEDEAKDNDEKARDDEGAGDEPGVCEEEAGDQLDEPMHIGNDEMVAEACVQ
jgi:hypothetical protein